MNTPSIAPQTVTLTAADGYALQALRYPAQGISKGHLIVAGATGVPQGFYRRFAEHASARGFDVLTMDYRGIGKSKPATLKGFRMNYLDWATLDLAAAVDAITDTTLPLFMVGHSFGGHAFGLLPNHARVAGFYTFGTGAGWHGWMPPLERIRVLFMWRVLGPLITRWKGYLAWSRLGMGEDLPLNVYRQWRQWCRFPRYFFDDPGMQHVQPQFDSVRTPMVALNALDDLWAPPSSRDAFMQGYRNAGWKGVDLDPRQLGPEGIGHMGYFRPAAQPLWQTTLDWFEQTAARPQQPV
jgi:predicted alpha/beta hydrolase